MQSQQCSHQQLVAPFKTVHLVIQHVVCLMSWFYFSADDVAVENPTYAWINTYSKEKPDL